MSNLYAYIRDILARLHAGGFPEAFCGGGAIRDLDNGVGPIKDVDVFVNSKAGLHTLRQALPRMGFRTIVPQGIAGYLGFDNVQAVYEFWEPIEAPDIQLKNPPVQVIVLKEFSTPEQVIKRHDFGLCQIGYDGEKVFHTPEYALDKATKTFTLYRSRDPKEFWRGVHRYQRLQQKYPGWPMRARAVVTSDGG